MFARCLSKNDIELYAEKVVCSMNDQIVTSIERQNIYSKEGRFECVYIEFYAYNTDSKDENKLSAEIRDYEAYNPVHNRFMMDKFGASYLSSFEGFVKSLPDSDLKRDYRYALKLCEKQYYDKINANKKQRTLDEYMCQSKY